MRRVILLVCVILLPLSRARADDCASPMTQSAMNVCADRAFQKTDADLNTAYGRIQQRLKSSPDTAKLMVAAQRAWLGFRDAECRFSTSNEQGGTIYPMIYSGCLDRLSRKRLEDFRTYLKCSEGDMSCPVPAN